MTGWLSIKVAELNPAAPATSVERLRSGTVECWRYTLPPGRRSIYLEVAFCTTTILVPLPPRKPPASRSFLFKKQWEGIVTLFATISSKRGAERFGKPVSHDDARAISCGSVTKAKSPMRKGRSWCGEGTLSSEASGQQHGGSKDPSLQPAPSS